MEYIEFMKFPAEETLQNLSEKEASSLYETLQGWIKCGGVKAVLKVVKVAIEETTDEIENVDELSDHPGYVSSVALQELIDHLETL
jgi:hypothetical protein